MYPISFLLGFGVLISISLADLPPQLKCSAKFQKEIKGFNVTKTLGSLVGLGWNDLTYKETLPIFATTFDQCQITPDADFLIPDGVFVQQIKESKVEQSAESYEDFNDFKSKHKLSVDVSGGGEYDGFGISGSLSYERTTAKEHMEKHSRMGFSKKLEYHAFEITATENAGFDKFFTLRLKAVADGIENGNLLLAQHEAERIIADYGTHVINKATVGAKAVAYGFATKDVIRDGTDVTTKLEAGLKAKFMNFGNGGFKISNTNEESTVSQSSTSEIHMIITGKGDVSIEGTNKKVDGVVGLKRTVTTIYSLIREGVLEHYNATTLETVKELIKRATMDYYRHNHIPGCTDSTSYNYFYKANVDDGTCKKTESFKLPEETKKRLTKIAGSPNYFDVYGYIDEYVKIFGPARYAPLYGGAYQQCEYINSSSKIHLNLEHGNHCDQYNHPNPFTGQYSCPVSQTTFSVEELQSLKFPKLFYKLQESGKFYASVKDRLDNAKDENCNLTECAKKHSITDKLLIKAYWCLDHWFTIEDIEKLPVVGSFADSIKFKQSAVDNGEQQRLLFYHEYDFFSLPPQLRNEKRKPGPYGVTNAFKIESIEFIEKAITIRSADIFKYNDDGMIFGGIFKKHNIFSDNGRCDIGFKEYSFFHNLKICWGVPNDDNFKKSVEFGGIISCNDSNQECPKGLSKYLATIINGCTYHYCASVADKHGFTSLPEHSQPPFIDRDMATSKVRFSHQDENDEAEDAKK